MVLIQSNSAQDFESLVCLHQWRQAENTWVLWKTRAKNVRKQVDIALILVSVQSNSLWHWNFEKKNETANFRHVPTQRNVILNIEISNDNSCAGSPPSNSNSDNSSFSKNEISESLNSNLLQVYQAKRCANQGLERWDWPNFSVLLPNNHCFRGSKNKHC